MSKEEVEVIEKLIEKYDGDTVCFVADALTEGDTVEDILLELEAEGEIEDEDEEEEEDED